MQDYIGISKSSKKVFFDLFVLYSTTALRIFLIFCKRVEDNRAHCLSQMVLLKKVLGPDYRGLIVVSKRCFLAFWPFLHNGSKDLLNLLHECRGQQGSSFEPDGSSNPKLQGIKSKNGFWMACLQNGATVGPFLPACYYNLLFNLFSLTGIFWVPLYTLSCFDGIFELSTC